MNNQLLNIVDINLLKKYLSSTSFIDGTIVDDKTILSNNTRFHEVISPINGKSLIKFTEAHPESILNIIETLNQAHKQWRNVPAPKRGELIRRIANEVRKHKNFLASIITLETGKVTQEALGEVQEWVDMCDFAVGLSRQLYGLNIASERMEHRLIEQWQPLGVIGIISAFNFPMAVWAWNSMLALVCGNTVLWKPSEQTPLCALFAHKMLLNALDSMPELPRNISAVICGSSDVGEIIVENKDIPLVSATGSTAMGKKVAEKVAKRLGKTLLELGGNNSMIVTETADQELAIRAIIFSAIGTNGQRCTTLRRLFLHKSYINSDLLKKVITIYENINIGDPNDSNIIMGPLINESSYHNMQNILSQCKTNNYTILGGERITDNVPEGGFYVKPAIVFIPYELDNKNVDDITSQQPILMKEETFAPILYVMFYNNIYEAIALNNDNGYGLSSSIFSTDIRETELFLSQNGSDCGIANVNIGTSGAEIGGAFGGEKNSGGGRESGSDCWRNYMRRQTATINYGKTLPLAQGIQFNV
jgi:aldehyde dehydrogenase (NAD+)